MNLIKNTFILWLASCPLWGQTVTNASQTQFVWPNSTAAQNITVSSTASGRLVIVAMGRNTTGITISSISGCGATWARATNQSASNPSFDIWYGVCTSATTTLTVTVSTGNTGVSVQIGQFSSTTGWQASPLGNNSITNTTSQTVTSPSITPAEPNDLIVAVHRRTQRTLATSPSSPWTNFTSTSLLDEFSWQQQGAAAPISATWTLNVGTSAHSTATLAFKPVANAIPNKVYSYLNGIRRAAFYAFVVASLGWDSRSVIARVREMLVQLKHEVEMALSRIAEMEMVAA